MLTGFSMKADVDRCCLDFFLIKTVVFSVLHSIEISIAKLKAMSVLRRSTILHLLFTKEITFNFICCNKASHIFKLHRRGLKSIVALLPLLGVTYVVGFFIEFHLALGYIFILLNSTQVCFCCCWCCCCLVSHLY